MAGWNIETSDSDALMLPRSSSVEGHRFPVQFIGVVSIYLFTY